MPARLSAPTSTRIRTLRLSSATRRPGTRAMIGANAANTEETSAATTTAAPVRPAGSPIRFMIGCLLLDKNYTRMTRLQLAQCRFDLLTHCQPCTRHRVVVAFLCDGQLRLQLANLR